MQIIKVGIQGRDPRKGDGSSRAEAITWDYCPNGRVAIPYNSSSWSYVPQYVSIACTANTQYTVQPAGDEWAWSWLGEGGVLQVQDSTGSVVASATMDMDPDTGESTRTPAVFTPASAGTYYLYIAYAGWGEESTYVDISVSPEPGVPPATLFTPYATGFRVAATAGADSQTQLSAVNCAADSPHARNAYFDHCVSTASTGQTLIIDNRPYMLTTGKCEAFGSPSIKCVAMLTDRLMLDENCNIWARKGDTLSYCCNMGGRVQFPDMHGNSNLDCIAMLVDNRLVWVRAATGDYGTFYRQDESKLMFKTITSVNPYHYNSTQQSVACGLDGNLYMFHIRDGVKTVDASGAWTWASGGCGESWKGLGIKAGALYLIEGPGYDEATGAPVDYRLKLMDSQHTWTWCVCAGRMPAARTVDGALYWVKWGEYEDPNLVQVVASGCTDMVSSNFLDYNSVMGYAIISGGLYTITESEGNISTNRVGAASDWTKVYGGGDVNLDSTQRLYGIAGRAGKMYAIAGTTAYELPSFTALT